MKVINQKILKLKKPSFSNQMQIIQNGLQIGKLLAGQQSANKTNRDLKSNVESINVHLEANNTSICDELFQP